MNAALPSPRAIGPVVVLRAWSKEVDPRLLPFMDELRSLGLDVVDHYVPPAGDRDLGDWARRSLALLADSPVGDRPAYLLGYCAAGHVLDEMLVQMHAAGHTPTYVGLIENWQRPPLFQIVRGTYWQYRVGIRRRLRHQLTLLSDGDSPPLREVITTWLKVMKPAVYRQVTPAGRRRLREARSVPEWEVGHLTYAWTFRAIHAPVHLYNATESLKHWDPDVTIGLAPLLHGGYVVRKIDGGHFSCLEGDQGKRLARTVLGDILSPAVTVVDTRR